MADVNFTAFAGLHTTQPPERIKNLPSRESPAVDLTEALNIDIDDSGQATRRAGQTLLIPGAAHSLWTTPTGTCLFVAGGALTELQADLSTRVLATGLQGGALSYLAVNERIYWCDALRTGVIEPDRRTRSWGLPITDEPSVLVRAGGELPAGLYQVAYTLLREDGQEGGCTLPASLTLPEGSALVVGWPQPVDPGASEVAVYLSEPNGMVMHRMGTYPAGQGHPNQAVLSQAGGALPLETQWMDAPPAGQHLAFHNGRILIAAGAFVFGTTALGYEWVDMRDFLALDGTPVAFVLPVGGGLFIGTAQAVYFCAGNRLEEYSLRTVVAAAALAGSGLIADGQDASGRAELAGQEVALFACAAGVYLGQPDGSVQPLTQERYQFAPRGPAAALFRREGALRQYLLFSPK